MPPKKVSLQKHMAIETSISLPRLEFYYSNDNNAALSYKNKSV